MAFLPWWLGAPALAAVSLGYFALTRRPMGVSGSFETVLDARRAREQERAAAELQADEAALRKSLHEATVEQFGALAAPAVDEIDDAPAAAPSLPWTAHVAFIACIFIGAFLATAIWRGPQLQTAPDDTYTKTIAGGWKAWAALAGGGALVGFGTRMSGGCTSGHGLSGCGRLQPGSLAATFTFVSCAVAVTALVGWLAS